MILGDDKKCSVNNTKILMFSRGQVDKIIIGQK